MVLRLCDSSIFGLLVILLLSNYSCKESYGVLIENADIPTSENVVGPEVILPQGTVRGMTMVSYRNRTFYGFKGIPYGQPPVGKLRFKAPLPANPWNGTLDATKDSKKCPQIDENGKFVGEEDCLSLHVFTPKLPQAENSTLLPVMVFIFGGAFKLGSNNPKNRGPNYLLNKDVVLVIPNYRMGILGYLSTGDEISPGNYGLKDLVEALRWTKRNVQYFGGNPNKVTIYGASSGSVSVHYLTLTNLTNGLFHKYITQSGSAIDPLLLPRKSELGNVNRLATYLGCPTNTSTLLVDCLRTLNASQIVDTNHLFAPWRPSIFWFHIITWHPTVEPDIEGALITDTPRNLIAAGKIRDLPWICSLSREDGIFASGNFYTNSDLYEELFSNFDFVMNKLFKFDVMFENATIYTEALKSYYFNDMSADKSVIFNNLTQLMTDMIFTYPASLGLQAHLLHAKSPVYISSFAYRGTGSSSYLFSGGSNAHIGAAHGDELFYLMPGRNSRFGPPELQFSETDWSMVDTMVHLWTSFASDEIPTVPTPNGTIIWEPYTSRESYLQVGNGSDPIVEIKHGFHNERMRFHRELNAAVSRL